MRDHLRAVPQARTPNHVNETARQVALVHEAAWRASDLTLSPSPTGRVLSIQASLGQLAEAISDGAEPRDELLDIYVQVGAWIAELDRGRAA